VDRDVPFARLAALRTGRVCALFPKRSNSQHTTAVALRPPETHRCEVIAMDCQLVAQHRPAVVPRKVEVRVLREVEWRGLVCAWHAGGHTRSQGSRRRTYVRELSWGLRWIGWNRKA
jgi:hypothetical protein